MGGGDGGSPWVVVLLGVTGAGKSSTANSLLNDPRACVVGHLPTSTTITPIIRATVIEEINVPVSIVDTPGFGDSKGRDEELVKGIMEFLQNEVRVVNKFILVVNGSTKADQQTFNMLMAYVNAFGPSILRSLIVVVTRWGMSTREVRKRERAGVTQTAFMQAWLNDIQSHIDTSLFNDIIPFIFIDNEVLVADADDVSEEERTAFAVAKLTIFRHLSEEEAVFPCITNEASGPVRESFRNIALSNGWNTCEQCKRYYTPDSGEAASSGSVVGGGVAAATQVPTGAARIVRVAAATTSVWTPDAAVKAMTRGWNANTGVHLAGKVASKVGLVVQLGVGVYRVVNANTTTEAVKAVAGTGAGIGGGVGGASLGATIGTFLLPGIGTIVGGIAGSLLGAFTAQYAAESLVGELARENICKECKRRQESG